jgi:hypothetical protein
MGAASFLAKLSQRDNIVIFVVLSRIKYFEVKKEAN